MNNSTVSAAHWDRMALTLAGLSSRGSLGQAGPGVYVQLSDIPIVARKGTSPIRQISHKQVKQERQCRPKQKSNQAQGRQTAQITWQGQWGHIPGSRAELRVKCRITAHMHTQQALPT